MQNHIISEEETVNLARDRGKWRDSSKLQEDVARPGLIARSDLFPTYDDIMMKIKVTKKLSHDNSKIQILLDYHYSASLKMFINPPFENLKTNTLRKLFKLIKFAFCVCM